MDDPEDSENRLYARRQYTTIRQMKSGLPNIPGVFALSKTEVKKDVREMERNLNDDTDSDSSILSEDVLISSYPVKPRKAPKIMIPIKPVVTGPTDIEREYDGKTVDQTLTFLDAVRRTKKDLYNAECEREKLEDESLSYRLCIEDTSKRYRQVKQEEGNYFRVIQGFHTQALRLQMGLNRQNTMFYDVLTALQRRKEANKSVMDNTAQLKKSIASNSSDGESAIGSGIEVPGSILGAGETAVLRVNLKNSGGQVVLFKGQWIRTPMGDGKILSILPQEEKIVLQLPFGKLYANLRRAVCWGKASAGQLLELSSDDVLRQKWTALQSSFSMPAEASRGIRELVGQSDDDAVTDKDDDNSNDDSSPTDTTAEDISSNSAGNSQSVERQDSLEGTGSAGSAMTTSSTSSADSTPLESNATAALCSFPLKGYLRSSSAPAAASGILSATLSRSALRSVCGATESAVSHQMELARTLPMLFAPTSSLPYLVEKSQATEIPEVRYCQQALVGGAQLGTLGSLVWEGDVLEMSRELVTLQDEINRLENEQNLYIGQIQSVRSRCAQFSTDTSALRLAMFTRRVRHRNNLNSHIMSNLANQASSSAAVPFPVFPFTGGDSLNSVLGVDGGVVPAATLRPSRGASAITVKEEGTGSGSRSSMRLVNPVISLPAPSPSGLGLNAFSSTTSCSPSPDAMNGEKGLNGDMSSQEISAASRKRGRDPMPAAEVLPSSRRRSAPTSSANEADEGRKSSSASLEDEEDEDEIKEETGSQDIEEDEKEEEVPSGVGSGRGGARNIGGLGKKKPRKQRRI